MCVACGVGLGNPGGVCEACRVAMGTRACVGVVGGKRD